MGRVGRPHGLDGSFYVTTPEAGALVEGRRLRLGALQVAIDRRAGTDAKPIIRVSACADRSAVEALRGQPLLILRSELPELEPGEFWADDVVGCAVSDGAREVGIVTALLGLPSCEVLEVARPDQGTLLVPLVSDAVRSMDFDARRIDVDLEFLGEV